MKKAKYLNIAGTGAPTLRKEKWLNMRETLSQLWASWMKSNSSGRFFFVSSASHRNWNSGKAQATIRTNNCQNKTKI